MHCIFHLNYSLKYALPPSDLFILSQVCRKFYGYLCVPTSSTTQQIWKESYSRYIPKENIPQPKGMKTTKYVELLMMERGCQILNSIIIQKNCLISCHTCVTTMRNIIGLNK
ncbi:unnamed protein product [Rhizophagus irregularis]|nr:unnamed protein product [Rhizophagus irregularis]